MCFGRKSVNPTAENSVGSNGLFIYYTRTWYNNISITTRRTRTRVGDGSSSSVKHTFEMASRTIQNNNNIISIMTSTV